MYKKNCRLLALDSLLIQTC